MITEQEYQEWLKRNWGMDKLGCQEMLNGAKIQYTNNPRCKAAKSVLQAALYCTERYIREELN